MNRNGCQRPLHLAEPPLARESQATELIVLNCAGTGIALIGHRIRVLIPLTLFLAKDATMTRLSFLLLTVAGLAGTAAQADPIEWDFSSGSNCANISTCYGNTRDAESGDGIDVNASSWSNTAGAGNVQIENAYLSVWGSSGLGTYNRDYSNGTDAGEGGSPEHAIDNNGRYEMVLFNFAEMVELTDLEIGWKGADSDMTVLAWTGVGAPAAVTGMDWGTLMGAGWSLIGQYSNVQTNTWQNINEAGQASRYWLIGAYNPVFGGDVFSTGNDYIKLSGLRGIAVTVDTPLSLPLLLSGLLVLAHRRRRS